jgi:hypothetical protein
MKKPTVYLDTSVISAFLYERADVAMLPRRLALRSPFPLNLGAPRGERYSGMPGHLSLRHGGPNGRHSSEASRT